MATDVLLRNLLALSVFVTLLHVSLGIPEYVGCYRDLNRRRVLSINPGGIDPNVMTPWGCRYVCGLVRYPYAGLDSGSACFCGDTLDQLILVDDNNCTMPCTGDPTQICGGLRLISVYNAQIPYSVDATVDNPHVTTGSSVSFGILPDTPAVAFNMRANYGDGAGFTPYMSQASYQALGSRTFYQAGDYHVGVHIAPSDNSQADVDVQTFVSVQSPVSGTLLTCPGLAVTYTLSFCTLEVFRGTEMGLTYTYLDGDSLIPVGPISFPIEDAVEYMMGNPVQAKLTIGSTVQDGLTTGQVVYTGQTAEHDGRLIGFEYFAVADGSLTVRVFEPVCVAPLDYCAISNTCENPCGMSCPNVATFIDTDTCSDDSFTKPTGLQAPVYSQIYSETIPVTAGYGYHAIAAGSEPDIPAGSVLSHETSNPALIGLIPLAAGDPVVESQALVGAGANFGPADCSNLQTVHQLKAIYSGLAYAKIPLEFTTSGSVTVSVSVSNMHPLTGPNTHNQISDFYVYEGINKCVPYTTRCLEVGAPDTLYVEPFIGSLAIVAWVFGDGMTGSRDSTQLSTEILHSYASIGYFDVKVNISNEVSWKYAEMQVCTMERITNLDLAFPLVDKAPTGSSDATLNMASGSNYTCAVDITYPEGNTESLTFTEEDLPIGSQYTFNFLSAGDAVVTTTCSNQINTVTDEKSIRVIEPITGISMVPPGAKANTSFDITIAWETGTDVQIQFFNYNGDPIDMPTTIDAFAHEATSLEEMLETETGLIPVQYHLTNPLDDITTDDVFVIEVAITRANLTCMFTGDMGYTDITAVPVDSVANCYIDMAAGTSVQGSVDFGDGTAPYTFQFPYGENFVATTLQLPQTHTYSIPNKYTLTVAVWNNFNRKERIYDVRVLVPLDYLEVNSVTAALHMPPADFDFTFYVTQDLFPGVADLDIVYGDGQAEALTDLDLSQALSHSYGYVPGDSGFVDVEFGFYNLISMKNITLRVQIVTPIIDSVCFTDPIATIPGKDADLIWMAARAPGAGGCNLEFDCSTQSGPLLRTGQSPNGQDRYTCNYAVRGNYTVSVVATSILETIQCPPYILEVMYPVTQDFTVTTNHPMDWHVAVDRCKLSLAIGYFGTPLPDRATIDIDYGDGTTENGIPFTPILVRSHTYTTHGHYHTTIYMFNKASEVTRIVTTGCYQRFTTLTYDVMRQPNLPLNSPLEVGYGVNMDKFRTDEWMVLRPILGQGTFVNWAVSLNPSIQFSYISDVEDAVSVEIPEYGFFQINVNAWNPLYQSGIVSSTVEMMVPVKGLRLADDGLPISAYGYKNVDISLKAYGTAMCIAIDSGEPKEQFIYAFGDEATCADGINIPGFRNYPVQYDPTIDVSAKFNFSTQYFEEGMYQLQAFAWNAFSNSSKSMWVIVSEIDCSAPNIDIEDRAVLANYAPEFICSNRVVIVGITDIRCPDTLKNEKIWRVYRWDEEYNRQLEEIDISDVPSRINSELSFDPQYFCKKGYGYGLYLAIYKVTMLAPNVNGVRFFSTGQTFLRVTKSPIVVSLLEYGSSEVTVGLGDTFSLILQQYSYDPDTVGFEEQTFDRYELACRDVSLGEDWVDCSATVQPLNLTSIPAGWVSKGGCFRMGCGWIQPLGEGNTLTVDTSIFTVNHKYEFYAKGYLDTRVGENKASVKIVAGNPPKFTIRPKMASSFAPHPEGIYINPSSQLGLVGAVADPCTGCTYTYKWDLYAYDHNYCYIDPDCFYKLTGSYTKYIKGWNTDELTIKPGLHDILSADKFMAELTVTHQESGVNGTTALKLFKNYPPKDGNCTFIPSLGIALIDNFTIECDGFVDDEGSVESYLITCTTGSTLYEIARGRTKSWPGKLLPRGNPDNGYILQCSVTVFDDFGASATYPIDNVTVDVLSTDDLKSFLDYIANNETSVYNVNDAMANLGATGSLVGSQGSLVADMGLTDEFVDYAGAATAFDSRPTTLSNEVRPNAFVSREAPAAVESFESDRASTARASELIVETLKKCTVESAENLETLLTALEAVSNVFVYLSRKLQEDVLEIMEDKITKAQKNEEAMSVELARSIKDKVTVICSNIAEGASLGIDKPSKLDVGRIEAAKLSTNMDTSLEELPSLSELNSTEELMEIAQLYMNKAEQRKTSKTIIKSCSSLEHIALTILTQKLPILDVPEELSSSNVAMHLYKDYGRNLNGRTLTLAGLDFEVSNDVLPATYNDTVIVLALTVGVSPGYKTDGPDSIAGSSRSLKANFMFPDGRKIKIKMKKGKKMLMKIKRDPNTPEFDMSTVNDTNTTIGVNEAFIYRQFEAKLSHSAFKIQFTFKEALPDYQLMVLFSHGEEPPTLGRPDETNIKHVCLIPSQTEYYDGAFLEEGQINPYLCFVDADVVNNMKGAWRMAIREADNLDYYTRVKRLPHEVPMSWINGTIEAEFKMHIEEYNCPYMESGEAEYKYEGAKAHWKSSAKEIYCETDHLTSFAGGWVVAPNAIDFSHVFANADFLSNPTLYITEIVIVLAYIIAMIWARKKDKEDVTKLGLAPLLDNDPRDKYYYEIYVETGMRRNAGTDSTVHFILSGEEEETDVRTFTDKKRKIFQTNSTNGFLMATPESLGALMYLRLWHDNSGKGPKKGWYLNHIIIRDIQTDRKYFFISNRWFAVEEDDGMVDRVIPVAGKEQMMEFSHMFKERAQKNLSDGHLWFSVVARPPQSRFTRCQRVSCCLCLLFTTMLANAMFYKTEGSDASAYTFGPFAITPEQIFIGIASNLIIFPVNFLLITIFRKSRPRKLRPSRVEEAVKSIPERSTSVTDLNVRVSSSMSVNRPGSSLLRDARERPCSAMSTMQTNQKSKKKKKCELPWGFTIVAWILLLGTTITCAFFVTMYGIQFGDMKCKKWITSMMISFFTSIFLTQPLKVFLFAIIFSLVIKNPGGDEEEDDDEEPPQPSGNDELLHTEADGYGLIPPKRAVSKPKPPNTKALEAARKQRLKEIQMWAVIREILLYTIYLMILLVISYRNVSINSYRYKNNMERVFIHTNSTNHEFIKIRNVQDYWVWARSGMLRGLRAGPYYNNYPPFYLRGYINDKSSRLMGYAVLRQVRVQPGSCKIPKQMTGVIDECNEEYDRSSEEMRSFGVGWSDNHTITREEYKYQDAGTLYGYPYIGDMAIYGGGGYVVKLKKDYQDMVDDFTQLEKERWIDEYTRAVFLEFTVYNPAVNMFSVSTLLAEFQPSGGVVSSYRFEPCMLLPYMNSVLLFQIACEIAYCAFTLYFVIKEFRNIFKQKLSYFKDFWNDLEFCIAAMSVTAIVIYFYRMICINEITEYFKETGGDEYMKFQYVGYWTEIFMYIVGFLVFFATLKFLKLLRFNKKISQLTSVLTNSGRDLLHFSVIFNVVFMAFIQFFYLLYHKHLEIFKTMVHSSEAGIVMMMGKFDIYKMIAVNSWLTQIFIFLFVLTITFIVVNMFLSILNESFGAVREDISKQQNDYEIVEFMLSRFKLWTGLGRANATTITPEKLERKKQREEVKANLNALPDQIDRFLASVSAMYIEKSKFDTQMDKDMYSKMAMKVQQYDTGYQAHPAPRPHGGQRLWAGTSGMTDIDTR